MANLADLIRVIPETEWLDKLLETAGLLGLPITDWESGSIQRTNLQIDARTLFDQSQTILNIASQGYLDTATGGWLELIATSFFNLERHLEVITEDTVRLTCDALHGPYTIQAGDLWFGTRTGQRYNSVEDFIIPAAGFIDVVVRAESPGATYNVPRGAISRMLTPLPGVSATNPVGGLRIAGADLESDLSLRRRCVVRWGELGQGPRDAYESWARSFPSVTKVAILDQHPRGQGTVDVILWGEGGVGSLVVAQANTYIQARRPVTADVLVYSAREIFVPLEARIEYPYALEIGAQAAVRLEIARIQRELGIGQTLRTSTLIDGLYAGEKGVSNVVLIDPIVDVALPVDGVATLIFNPAWVPR